MMHEHECSSCPVRFDCDHELTEGICPVTDCRRCRERLHAEERTADLMPIDYYAIKNATVGHDDR